VAQRLPVGRPASYWVGMLGSSPGAVSQSRHREAPGGRTMRHMTLPNRRRIAVISRFAARDVYEEIFDENIHLRGGLRIGPGDVVLDIGADVGVHMLYAKRAVA